MSDRLRLGAVGYLNARPLVYGLELAPRFSIRYDIPAECARLLHAGEIDLGLIPSIEFLRGPATYSIVPDLAIASRGAVMSVALYTTKPIKDVRSIAIDTSSRTSVALVTVLCDKLFGIEPLFTPQGPDLPAMLARNDAALIIGDNALLVDHTKVVLEGAGHAVDKIEKIDLGTAWFELTGLPFVYAFWAGRPGAATEGDVEALQRARNAGVTQPELIAREYFPDSRVHQALAVDYLQDNIKYYLGDAERTGLETFYRYAAEAGVVTDAAVSAAKGASPLRFY